MDEFSQGTNEALNSTIRRVRQLEENLRNIRNQLSSIENDVLAGKKALTDFKKDITEKIEEMKINVENLRAEVRNVERIARKSVSKRELQELESFMEIFNPLKSKFVTKEEVIELIKEQIEGV
jgi:archaellum component FlaC